MIMEKGYSQSQAALKDLEDRMADALTEFAIAMYRGSDQSARKFCSEYRHLQREAAEIKKQEK